MGVALVDPVTIAGWVWGGLATLAAIAASWVRIRSSVDEETLTLWKGEAEAWKARAERIETEFEDIRRRVEHVEAENRLLRELHSNRADVATLLAAITDGFADIRKTIKGANE